jgi:mannose-6-phosphate isomerase-like protein (cupin superfamily)
MNRDNLAQYIVTDIPKTVWFPGHHEPSSVYLSSNVFPQTRITVDADNVSKLVDREVADLHTHEVPEVYLAIAENRGDMVFEVTLGDQTFTVEAPMVVYIPAGLKHKFRTIRAHKEQSYLLGILLDYAQ